MSELYHTSGENASGNCIERPGYYAVIPADVRYDMNIPANAKLIYGEISALIGPEGFCYASNAYFAAPYGFTEEAVSRMIAKLIKAGYIIRELDKDASGQIIRRRLYLKVSAPDGRGIDQKINTPQPKNQEGIDQKIKENNLSNTILSTHAREVSQDKPNLTLTREQLEQHIRQCTGTLAKTNHWSDSEREAVCKLVQEFYSPRAMNGKPPKHTTRGINGLFRKLAPNGRCSAKAAGEMLNEAIERGWTSVYPHEERGRAPARAAAPSVHLGAEL